ncbi:SDR family oxidoreductase [Sediminicoccus sp. KRV36]|uniref:SDR family oxidoreductase n=1 Tax=Sediminicoccus sp. KRV36 TaxID=3133721 RepID=UPI00200F1EF7|nr:SDR family oxidoreductase [Sediminicoccus rosea]UPY34879.1 SDR family oxidoreductase [Sediminicoccus rosea]
MARSSDTRTHLVTGATGLVGGALILELLDNTQDQVVALVRPSKTEDAQARLIASLREAVATYGRDPATVAFERVRGIAGDLTQPCCGVAEPPELRADVMWHSAASLRYEDRYEEQIMQTNVCGTRHAIELALRSGVKVFNAVSTAYVSGAREGQLMEIPRDGSATQNHYETSKVAAEAMLRECSAFDVRVFRPSIVVGHSQTLGVTTFSGLYSFTRKMMQYRGVLERVQKGLSRERRIRLRADAHTPLDLIPVDAVAAQAVHIGLKGNASGIYHLTQQDPPSVGDTLTAIATEIGFQEPEFVDADAKLDWLDGEFDKGIGFYGNYIRTRRVFDRSRTDRALGNRTDLKRRLPPVRNLVAWYAKSLEQRRLGMPVSR